MAILVIVIHHAIRATEDSALGGVVEILEAGGLRHSITGGDVLDGGSGENLSESLESLGVIGPVLLGELDVELKVHVAEVVVPGRRHTLAANHLDSICNKSAGGRCTMQGKIHTLRDSLAGEDVNGQPSVIEVLDVDGTTSQSCNKLNIAVIKQIIFATSEASMGLLLNLENDVTCLNTWCLVTLASELDLGATADTLVDVDVEDLAVDSGLLSVALLAAVLLLDDLTLSVTVGADSLEALDHGTHLAHHGLHTVAITASATLNRTLLSTKAFALRAND